MTLTNDQPPDKGVLKPGPWLWLRAIGWMLALTIGLGVLAYGEPVVRFALHRPMHRMTLWGPALGLGLAYAAYVVLVRRFERRWPAELSLGSLPQDLMYGAAIGAAMFALVFLILERLGAYSLVPGGQLPWIAAIAGAVCTALAEELLFRAVIFRLLTRALGPWWALILSATLFGAAHFANPHATPMASAAIAVEAGLMLAALYLASGRLWAPVAAHAAWNFTQGPVFGAAVSGHEAGRALYMAVANRRAPDLITGGDFGPEASLPAMLVGLAVFAIALLVWLRRKHGPALIIRRVEAPSPTVSPAAPPALGSGVEVLDLGGGSA